LWLSAPPLLRGVLEANKIELKRPVLRLALDDKGTGNWSRLTVTRGALPFVPAGVTLQSVRILDGTLAVHAPNGRQLLRLDELGGELAADSLDGPYKFKGSARWRGSEREIRLATSEPQPDGAVRFKASVRAPQTDNTYTLDGRASDLRTRPRIEGELTAKIAVAPQPATGPGEPLTRVDAAGERPTFDARGQLEVDAAQLRLKDVTMTLEQAGQPQLVTGEATLGWRKELRLDLALASRWLDLDRISGGGASPAETARRLMALGGVLPSEAELGIGLSVDQANVGGELIGGLRVELARAPGGIVVKELRAQLPGTTRLDLSGAIAEATSSGDSPVTGFVGDIALKGASLARFAGWLGKTQSPPEARDGPFSLQGRLGLSDSTFELAEAAGEIAGMPLKGELRYESGKRRRLSLEVDGQRIDADQLLPRAIVRAELGALLPLSSEPPQPRAERASEAAGKGGWFDPAGVDMRLRVRADEFIARGHTLRNVDADLTLERGRLAVPALKFATADGLALDVEGEFTNLGAEPVGRLKGDLEAAQAGALPALAALVGLEPGADAARRLGDLAPLRVAGTLSLGERAPAAADLSVDGTVHGGRVSTSARFDRGPEGWLRAPADVTLTAESPDVERLLGMLLPAARAPRPNARQASSAPRPGQVFVKVVGTPAQGLVSLATVKAEALSLAYDGRIAVSAAATAELDGRLQITSERLGSVLALVGLPLGEAAASVPVEGTLEVALKDGTLRLRPRGLELGGATVAGSLALSRAGAEPPTLSGELSAEEAQLGRLLALVTRRGDTAAGAGVAAEPQGAWPEAAFDLAWADDLQGRVALRLGRLALEGGLAMTDVRAEASIERGAALQTRITGKALGGAAEASARIQRAAAGVTASVDLRLADAHLEAFAPGQDPRSVSGTATLTLAASGQALSPAALVAALEGRGEVQLGDVELEGLAPVGIVAAADAVLDGNAGASGDALFTALRSELNSGQLKLGPREIPIEVRNGAARLQAFTMETPEGRTTVETTVDLGLLKFDSEWRIEPAAPARGARAGANRAALPAVSVYYVGSLRDLHQLEPRLSYGAFERELAVRRMEREVEELERLRKGDEEWMRQERVRKDDQEWMRQERQRALGSKASGTRAPDSAGATSAIPGGAWQSTVVPQPAEAAPPGAVAGQMPATRAPQPAQRPTRARAPSDEILRQISPY
jgi:hypothetical protein